MPAFDRAALKLSHPVERAPLSLTWLNLNLLPVLPVIPNLGRIQACAALGMPAFDRVA